MNHPWTEPVLEALASMRGEPKPLLRRVNALLDDDVGGRLTEEGLVSLLDEAHPDDPVRKNLHLALAQWDHAPSDVLWMEATEPSSAERRQRVYCKLDLGRSTAEAFERLFPPAKNETVVISDEFHPWYTQDRAAEHDFYWYHYRRHLLEDRKWPADAVARLDQDAKKVVERLADPTEQAAYQSKGLVVGYVQSGKTANFLGVIAKAADAGYRLVIVLTGTVEMLRAQTQRRLDMQLVGRENILAGADPNDPEAITGLDYQDDPDWLNGGFNSFGARPSSTGWPDIVRLTTHQWDYRSLRQGIKTLEFEHVDPSKPLVDPVNIHRTAVRLIVVKKNSTVLRRLVSDLRQVSGRVGQVPALIIDDESDQASVNTSNPKKWTSDERGRNAVNRRIAELLSFLPRAQYVGYTATPFANVFVDPTDPVGIFPKDFVIALDRPPGYMGVRDFHDIDDEVPPDERTVANSQEQAHVRNLTASGETADQELREAMDAFVLTGAVKLYREAKGASEHAHHTMLVHQSVRQAEHRELANKIARLWREGGYSSSTGLLRLRSLYTQDILPVSRARAEDLPTPGDFQELEPYIAESVTRITSAAGDPVLVINSDQDLDQEHLDFDKRRVWRILVGGMKLSRGFTIEGLTVSYYRRTTYQAATLMQTGRWFGFRDGYRDLVRLYIDRAADKGAKTFDLYEAFEAVCRDEEAFRAELERYAVMVDGRPQITPKQIPPLVSQHLPWLKPDAPNKMFNAKLVERRSPGTPIEPVAYPLKPEKLGRNAQRMRPLLEAAHEHRKLAYTSGASGKLVRYVAWTGLVRHDEVVAAVRELEWLTEDHFLPDLRYLTSLGSEEVQDWAVILPQHQDVSVSARLFGGGPYSLFKRRRREGRGGSFGALSDPKHRRAAERIAAGTTPQDADEDIADGLVDSRRGAVLVYPVIEDESALAESEGEVNPERVVLAFVAVPPTTATRRNQSLVTFTVHDPSRVSDPIIDR